MAVMVTAIIVASGIFALQRGRMALLRAENQALVAEKGNPRIVSKVSLSPAPGREPNPFPTTQEELSRLRQEVAQLAGELEAAEARARQHAGRLSNSASSRADQRGLRVPFSNSAGDLASNDPPSFQYSANVRVTVPWNQTAVTGGWQLPTGNRGFVLATPNQGEDTAHLRIETQVVELSQATAERLGLGGPSAEERECN